MFAGLFTSETKAGYGDVSFNFFYHNLRTYGEWIEIDADVIVWRPYNVDRTWSPYSVGNWEYTSYGWYWDSYEPYGWATYHYGRWYYDDYYSWVWVPGYEWGPSWVEWRYSNSYIGWSPLPPYADFRYRVGIHFSSNYRSSYYYWNFVSYNHFCNRNVYVHYVDSYHKNTIFNNTKYRTNYYSDRGRIINGGVDRNFVERRAGNRITEREVQRTTDLRNYTGTRGDAHANRIVAYQPEEREVNKYRDIKINDVNRGSVKSSLKRENITFRNEEVKSRETARDTKAYTGRDNSRNESPQVDYRRNSTENTRPVITRGKDAGQGSRNNTQVTPRQENTREVYKVPQRIEQKVQTVKLKEPVRKQNNSYRSSSNNNQRNNSSTVRKQTQPKQSSVSRSVTPKRAVQNTSRSTSTSPKKKRK